MFRIIDKRDLAKDITKIVVEAPQIAKKAKAGQFVVVIVDEKGERIPLTLADWDKNKGTISLIFQKVGYTTKRLGTLNIGDNIQHILGPLGHPTETNPSTLLKIDGERPSTSLEDRTLSERSESNGRSRTTKNMDTVICIGGGVGIAEVYPVSRAFKEAGNRVMGIIGARSKDLLILEKEMKEVCEELFITTDDGSYGEKGFVSDVLKKILNGQTGKWFDRLTIPRTIPGKVEGRANGQTNLVYAIGPVLMMKAVSLLTKDYKIKTIVSLNSIMVDATGMCGSCRCTVDGKTVFGCVDGPDFDGHQVNFEELEKRLNLFRAQEESLRQ